MSKNLWKRKVLVAWLCPTLCGPMDYCPPDSSVLGILQERILEWVAIISSKGSFQPRDWTRVSHIAGRFFTIWATGEFLLLTNICIQKAPEHLYDFSLQLKFYDANSQPVHCIPLFKKQCIFFTSNFPKWLTKLRTKVSKNDFFFTNYSTCRTET